VNDLATPRRLRLVAIAVAVIVLCGCRTVASRAPLPSATPRDVVSHAGGTIVRATGDTATATAAVPASYAVADVPWGDAPPALPAGDCAQCRGPLPVASADGCRTCDERCALPACLPLAPPPVIVPPPVCDGGDHGLLALPVGADGLTHVTAGDTVARYRAADAADPEQACLTTTNCACVFAPRFASVREVIRPFEDTAPTGPHGVSLDTIVEADSHGERVCRTTLPIGPEAARRAQPPVAAEERLPPLAVDNSRIPNQAEGLDGPAARLAIDVPARHEGVEDPRMVTGFDVPYAWTCVSAAQVTVNGESTDVIAVDRGTATLRLEHPGRCELTLCKRAGSDAVKPGEELDFTIFLLNSGDRALADIVLVDAVPPRLEVITGSAVSNLPADISTGTAEDGGTLLSWKLRGELPPGAGGFVRFRTIVR